MAESSCVIVKWSSVTIIRSLFVVVCLQSAPVGESRLKIRFLEFGIKFVVDHKNRYQSVNSSLEQRLIPLASSTEEPELR